jgi:hypothetical protein
MFERMTSFGGAWLVGLFQVTLASSSACVIRQMTLERTEELPVLLDSFIDYKQDHLPPIKDVPNPHKPIRLTLKKRCMYACVISWSFPH